MFAREEKSIFEDEHEYSEVWASNWQHFIAEHTGTALENPTFPLSDRGKIELHGT
jgi:hypothetical protein